MHRNFSWADPVFLKALMNDHAKTKQKLIAKLQLLRQRVAERQIRSYRFGFSNSKHYRFARYALAFAAVAVAFLLKVGLNRLMSGDLPPFIFFYPTILLVALLAGLRPGILATVTAAMLANVFFLEPRGQFFHDNLVYITSLVLFTSFGVFLSVVGELYRRNRGRLEGSVAELNRANRQLQQEIAERQQAEEALRKTKAELEDRAHERTRELVHTNQRLLAQGEILQKIIDNIPVMIVSYESSGKVNFLNDRLREVIGISAGEVEDTDILARVYPDPAYRQEMLTFTKEALPGWKDIIMHVAGGKELETSWTTVRLSDGSHIGIGIDISARKQAEEKLRKSEEYWRHWFDDDLSGDAIVNGGGYILACNPAFITMFGYTDTAELIGQHISLIYADGMPAWENLYSRLTANPRILAAEMRGHRKDGSLIDVEKNCIATVDAHHRLLEIKLYVLDISERKRAERALQESSRVLRDLSVKLLSAQEDERKLVAMDLHDTIAASLSAIKMRLQRVPAARSTHTSRDDSIAEVVGMVDGTIAEVRRIMANLRPSMLDDLGLLPTIRYHCREFQKLYSELAVAVTANLAEEAIPQPLKIVMFRVLQEALTNISKHSQATEVHIALGMEQDQLELAVTDNGCGFDLKSTRAASKDGKGFGLSSMHERVRLSGGSFMLQSTRGKGTVIQARWPQGEPESLPGIVPASTAVSQEEWDAHKRETIQTILLVEDNEVFRHAFRDTLLIHFPDVQIKEAAEGVRALEIMREWQPQLIFMDINLPGENGLHLTQRIKELIPEIAVIILTSCDTPEYREAALEAGACHFVVKGSLSMEEIDALIRATSVT